MHSKAGYRISS